MKLMSLLLILFMWGWRWLESLVQDLRYGLRQLRRSPGFTAVVVLSLALGIGANTAIFSLIDAVMLRMLPVKNPQQLVLLNWVSPEKPAMMRVQTGFQSTDATGRLVSPSFSYTSFEEFREHNAVFSSLFGFDQLGRANVNIDGQANLAKGVLVTGDYFSGLGVSPMLGRAITEEDEEASAPRVAVISYGYWSRQFGRSRAALGKAITINGVPFTVVGVAPPKFVGVIPGYTVDVWVPLVQNPKLLPWGASHIPGEPSPFTPRDWWWLMMMGRLKPGVTVQQANTQLEVLFQQSITANLKAPPKPQFIPHIQLQPAGKGVQVLRKSLANRLWVLMIAVGLVLLIACANVATLLIARSTARQKEIAVRLSLGASRSRLVRQLLSESVLLACIGGALGLLFAQWGSRALLLLMSNGGQPLNLDVHLDARVLGFTAAVSMLTGVLFGIAPALKSTRIDLTPALKVGAGHLSTVGQRTRLGLGKSLVVVQVALSLLLLVGAGLFVRTLGNLEDQNLGFSPHHLLLFGIDPTHNGYKGQHLIDFYGRLLQRLQGLPRVESATMSTVTLISGSGASWTVTIEDHKPEPGQNMDVNWNGVGPSFFKTMGIRLLLGRGIKQGDTSNSPKIAVVNEAFAQRFLGGRNPIGHRFRFESRGDANRDYEIVGMAQDAKYANLRIAPRPTAYLPFSQMPVPLGRIHFELRTASDPMAFVPTVRRVVRELDPDLPLADIKTQSEQIAETLVQERLFARLSSFFGGVALILACIGLYGLMAYTAKRRTGEIGIRMALGAQRSDILKMVMKETLAMVALGIVIGILASLAATRLISNMLYGLKPTDPLTLAIATSVILGVVMLAGYLPARHASRVDPAAALRSE